MNQKNKYMHVYCIYRDKAYDSQKNSGNYKQREYIVEKSVGGCQNTNADLISSFRWNSILWNVRLRNKKLG